MKNTIAAIQLIFFLSVSFSLAQAPPYNWSKYLVNPNHGVGGNDIANSIVTDASGNMFVTGTYSGTVDFDPTSNVDTMYQPCCFTAPSFFAKYSPSGNLLWVKKISNATATKIEIGSTGNLFICGSFAPVCDFDPSAATATIASNGGVEGFIACYDNSGNYLWANPIGGSLNDFVLNMELDALNNIHIHGTFSGSADFDPSPATSVLTTTVSSSAFIAKYSLTGTFIWARAFNTVQPKILDLCLEPGGDLLIMGDMQGPADFDLSPGTATFTTYNNSYKNAYFARYNSSGNFMWCNVLGDSPSTQYGQSICLNSTGDIFICGAYNGVIDLDPSLAAVTYTNLFGAVNMFVARYNFSGAYSWGFVVGGNGNVFPKVIETDALGDLRIAGEVFGGTDFDPSPAVANVFNNVDDIFISKYTSGGNYVWAKVLGSTGTESLTGMSLESSGNTNICGKFVGVTDFDPSLGGTTARYSDNGNSFYAAKYSPVGNFSCVAASEDYVKTSSWTYVGADASGNLYATGCFANAIDANFATPVNTLISTQTSQDVYIIKYSAAGNFIWAKQFGGSSSDIANNIVVRNNEIVIAGNFFNMVDFDPGPATATLWAMGNPDNFIAKYDTAGNYIWAKAIRGATLTNANSMKLDSQGNIYIAGLLVSGVNDFDPSPATYSINFLGGNDAFIAKYNSLGNLCWAKPIAGPLTEQAHGLNVSGQDLYVTGTFSGTTDFDPSNSTYTLSSNGNTQDIFLAKYDTAGNFIWVKGMGGTDVDVGVACNVVANGDVVLTGYFNSTVDFDPGPGTQNITSNGWADVFLAKYDLSGNFIWAGGMGGSTTEEVTTMDVDPTGKIYLGGLFSGPADMDPSPAVATFTSLQVWDMYVACYLSNGSYDWAFAIEGTGNENIGNVCVDQTGVINVGGYFAQSCDLDPSAQMAWCYSDGGAFPKHGFFAKYGVPVIISSIFDKTKDGHRVTLFPNPTKGEINLMFGKEKYSSMRIYDSKGTCVFSEDIYNEQQLKLNLIPGLYFYEVSSTAGPINSGKIIVTE